MRHHRLELRARPAKLRTRPQKAPVPPEWNPQMKPDEVREVAKLARLELTEDEISTYAGQLTKVLDYVALLDEVDTEGVEPMVHALDQGNVFRVDEVRPTLSREDALSNAPKTDGKYFQVPQVIDQQSS